MRISDFLLQDDNGGYVQYEQDIWTYRNLFVLQQRGIISENNFSIFRWRK
jgi:hypothetical protein